MPLKTDHNVSIKDYMKGPEKQQGKSKTKDVKGSKQTAKPLTMSKEAGANSGSNVKTSKPINEDHTPHKEEHTNLNQKRDASKRSPLEGNPGKKQKENNQIEINQTTEDNSL